MKIDSQVLVVGAGPAGLALAAELEIAGIHTVVVEQLAEPDTLQMARGVGVLAEVGDRPLAGLVNNAGILRVGPLEFVPIDTVSANRYARTPASFVHRMGASTHDICSPGRDTRGQHLDITKTRLRLDTPVSVLPVAAGSALLVDVGDRSI
ncbi:MAG TPA: FAD-dependent monooxygenase [Mycobacterium sp.]